MMLGLTERNIELLRESGDRERGRNLHEDLHNVSAVQIGVRSAGSEPEPNIRGGDIGHVFVGEGDTTVEATRNALNLIEREGFIMNYADRRGTMMMMRDDAKQRDVSDDPGKSVYVAVVGRRGASGQDPVEYHHE